MKIYLKSKNSIGFLSLIFSLLLLFALQDKGYSQACVECDSTTTAGLFPSAIGRYTTATGNYSFAGGIYSVAEGQASFAFGNRAKTFGGSSLALGQFVNITASTAMGIGFGFDIDNPLVNNVPRSFMIGIGSTKPTLFVGESIGVNRTGKIGIGNMTDPQAKLHILSDENEAATLKLEHQTTGINRFAQLFLGDHSIKAGNTENMVFSTPTADNHFVFENGNVGIGISNPTANLHVQGNFKLGSEIGEVGENAFAGGQESEATGDYAIAYGNEAHASGLGSIALGYKVTASGLNSVALGENVKATMRSSFVAGRNSQANSISAVALGHQAFADGGSSVAIGNYVQTSASEAFAFGSGAGSVKLVNSNPSSLLMGFNSNVSTFFVGSSDGVGTTGRIGIGNITNPGAKLHILSDENEAATLKLEHQTTGTKRFAQLFLGDHSIKAGNIENMVFSTPTADKHFIFENGNVGIGTSDPTSVLHVHNNEEPVIKLSNDHANLILALANTPWQYAPTSQAGDVVFKTHYDGNRHGMIFNMNDEFNDGNSYIKFNDNHNHHSLTILNNGNIGFGTAEPKVRVHIEDGDIYLHDIQSGIIMRSPSGQCWRGKLNDQGMLAFEQTTCPDGATSQPETMAPAKQLKVYPNPASGFVEVHTGAISGKLALSLMDASGKQLREQQAQAGKNILKLEGLPAGAYILVLKKDGELVESTKVLVD